MIRFLCLLLLACPLAAAAGPKEKDAAAKDLASLQGKWRFVEEESGGLVTRSCGM